MEVKKRKNYQSKILLTPLMILLSSLLSCAVTVPDKPLCVEINPFKGYCTNTVSSNSYYIDEQNKLDGKSWWELRPTMLYMPHDTWVEIKSFIIKVCKKYKCSGTDLSKWERASQTIDETIQNN